MSDPTITDIHRYERAGSVAAYEHCAMIRLHYHIADALDDCLRRLAGTEEGFHKIRRESAAMHAAHQAALQNNAAILGIPDHVDASTETSSSGDDEDDEGKSGFDQTEGYVSSTRRRKNFVMKEHP
jgi:hypothetical protein